MFRHILVPLDGSALAEAALPSAMKIAELTGAQVTLVHVIEKNPPEEIHGEHHLSTEEEASSYLTRTAENSFHDMVRFNIHVHTEGVKDVPQSIVDHTAELDPDLIVMCAHGASGLSTWMVGNIAQRVIERGKMPTLLIQPDDQGIAQQIGFGQFLVALDGHPDHEQALTLAGRFALAGGAGLHLVTVVHNLGDLRGERAATGKLLPGATRAMLDLSESSMYEYLEEKAEPWRKQGIPVKLETMRGEPARQIVQAALDDDLIVLGTHGKTGMDAFWAGSVGTQIISSSKKPMLLVPVHSRHSRKLN